ncbi:MAG: PSD1 domain-containing protein [Planctomycetaceae bacterium]|nr:PSD1 domain-containing protein [Planctomycetaceae bacterium]
MVRFRHVLCCALSFVVAGGGLTSTSADDRPLDYQRNVRPILADKCFQCHGPDAGHRQADLRLDMAPPKDGSAIRPGHPDDSEIIRRIESSDPETRMPPARSGKAITPAETAILRRWIAEGARWSDHWAYVTPAKRAAPGAGGIPGAAHWIDAFLLERLQRDGRQFAPAADRVTLLRRLSFDLRGLPPSPEEVRTFVADVDPRAVEKVVDRYLASDEYGERMATVWLDLVRFADTVGYHGDQVHHITPYRDWVIDAFIDDMPFDQFTREQLAGDLLPDATVDQRIASGYNRLLQTSHEGGVQEKEYLAMYAADRVRNLSAVWLGATVGCAPCHDHKFDPYTQRDFYALAAFFADLDEAQHLKRGSDASPTVRAPELRVHTRRERAELAAIDDQILALRNRPTGDEQKEATAKQIADLEARKMSLEKAARLTMISAAIEPRTIRLLPRGNWLDESGPIIEPAVPSFLGGLNVKGRRPTRLDLARWLTDPRDGAGLLTARVMVNRFWAILFGAGLSRSLEDFGAQGEAPDHPELLDRLAVGFVENGWRIKPLLRQIVLTRAYQQSSVASDRSTDPDNRLLSRQARFRLPAEMIRDNALAISGLLVRQLGGPSVHPYQPAGYYKHLNFPKRDYHADNDARQWRRGLYVHWQRQFLHPMLKAFDAPRREECVPRRSRSNTPLAALALLNDPSFIEAARAFAARILAAGATDEDRINAAFEIAVSRTPDDRERVILLKLLQESRSAFLVRGDDAAARVLATGLAPQAKDHPTREVAAWTMVARALLNLSETVTRP